MEGAFAASAVLPGRRALLGSARGGLRARGVRAARRARGAARMAAGAYVAEGLVAEDYVCLGVAACFQRVEGKLQEVLIVEPLPASAVDCVARLGVPTSYRRLHAMQLGDLSDEVGELPAGVVADGESVAFAEDFGERVAAAARTFRRSPEIAALHALGATNDKLNHSVATKRILNEAWEPRFDDNVKQDISIDVYDRAADVDASEVRAAYNA